MATPILMPRQGQSVESCILVAWKVARGDTVTEGEALAEIETDKATFELESPAAGTVVDLFFDEGEDIPVLTAIGAIGAPGEDVSDLRPGEASSQPPPPSPAGIRPEAARRPATGVDAPGISPRARMRARRDGVVPSGIRGTGPGSRIIERDILDAAARGRPRDPGPPAGTADRARTTEIPVAGVRKIIADRMHASLAETAQLTLHRRFDATAIQTLRKKVKEHGPAYALPDVTLNDMIVFATSRTLRRHPALNAHFLGDRIVQFEDIHIGIAVDTPRGLLVPVLRSADAMSLARMSDAIRTMVEACRLGNAHPDLLSGGTFTITNLGALGIESFTPILNAPEVAILGVGAATPAPVMEASGMRHVSSIHLSLTINHQAVDGAPAARFLADLASALADFELLLTSEDPGSNA